MHRGTTRPRLLNYLRVGFDTARKHPDDARSPGSSPKFLSFDLMRIVVLVVLVLEFDPAGDQRFFLIIILMLG